jgi:hypothetical protein
LRIDDKTKKKTRRFSGRKLSGISIFHTQPKRNVSLFLFFDISSFCLVPYLLLLPQLDRSGVWHSGVGTPGAMTISAFLFSGFISFPVRFLLRKRS